MNKKVTIIIANPKNEGFNYERAKEIINRHEGCTVINLYQDQFNPVLTNLELTGVQYQDIEEYQTILMNTQKLYIVYPIWWGAMPAILKGFFDRVFAEGFAFERVQHGLKGKLNHIEEANLVTTSNSPKWYIRLLGGNGVKKGVGQLILKASGVRKIYWYHNGEEIKNKR